MKVKVDIQVTWYSGENDDIENELNATAMSFDRAKEELAGLESAIERELAREARVIPEEDEVDEDDAKLAE